MRREPDDRPTTATPGRLRRHWRAWAPYWIAAAALLAASEALWWWQTWPVRDLLGILQGEP